MGRLVHEAMEGMGIDVRTESQVEGFVAAADGHVDAVWVNGAEMPADIVICGLGVRPNTAVAKAAGLRLGNKGGLRTDLRMRVAGMDNVWAGRRLRGEPASGQRGLRTRPLGTHANKHFHRAGTMSRCASWSSSTHTPAILEAQPARSARTPLHRKGGLTNLFRRSRLPAGERNMALGILDRDFDISIIGVGVVADLGIDRTGTDRVHTDLVWREFHRQHLG
jgi:hypothetical protein